MCCGFVSAGDIKKQKLNTDALPMKVYFAGNIFSQKDLIGNL